MTKPAVCRIDGIVAREAPTAVIFRRGPSKMTQLLTWNLETDEVTPGQWIHAKVYTRRCDVSPDGRHLVAAFTDYSSRRDPAVAQFGLKESWMANGWTAVSRPPYFTALALWFTGGAWNGGGLWESDRLLKVNNMPYCWREAIAPKGAPFKVRKPNLHGGEDEPIFSMRLEQQGWVTESPYKVEMADPKGYEKSSQTFFERIGQLTESLMRGDRIGLDMDWLKTMIVDDLVPKYVMKSAGSKSKRFRGGSLRFEEWLPDGKAVFETQERWSICSSDGRAIRVFLPKPFHPQFLDVDHRGRILFGEKGCLWAWTDFPDGEPSLIADLNGNRFEAFPAPDWARQW